MPGPCRRVVFGEPCPCTSEGPVGTLAWLIADSRRAVSPPVTSCHPSRALPAAVALGMWEGAPRPAEPHSSIPIPSWAHRPAAPSPRLLSGGTAFIPNISSFKSCPDKVAPGLCGGGMEHPRAGVKAEAGHRGAGSSGGTPAAWQRLGEVGRGLLPAARPGSIRARRG